jgi:large repetitive protein
VSLRERAPYVRRLFKQLSSLALVLTGTGAAARPLENYDAVLDAKPAARMGAGFEPVGGQSARIAHMDERHGTPSFVWVNARGGTPQRAQFARMAPEKAALAQLEENASVYGLKSFQDTGAKVTNVSRNTQGVTIVTLEQNVGGVEIFRQQMKLVLNANNELVAISGALSPHVSATTSPERLRFRLGAPEAIATAYQDLTGTALDPSLLKAVAQAQGATDPYAHYELTAYARPLAEGLLIPARAKRVLYPMPDALVPAYYLELNTGSADSRESDYYSYVVSAQDGRLLARINLTAHADFSYRVWADTTPPYTPTDGPSGNVGTPHPTGSPNGYQPPYIAPVLLTLQNAPYSKNDPWLPPGAVETTGNNADAYADLTPPDFYNAGDLRPGVTAPGVFDRTFTFDIQPNANNNQIAAATTQLFYVNNWLHDWWYDSGFDEVAGNAQSSNYGRGGQEKDPIAAQAQDYSGTNNANMSTPADGASPRMQMYLFSGPANARITVTAPGGVAGDYDVGVAAGFGPQTFDLSAPVALVNDGTAPVTDACTALTNGAELSGKIAFIDRGTCDFVAKVQFAQNAGAVGVIIADNAAGPVAGLGGTSTAITIPTLRITLADGNKLRATIPGLAVRLFRGPTINLDGTIDNGIVAHEWGHYISNRLIGNAAGLSNNQGRSMGEGWGDFTALLMITRAEDANVPSNANWNGAFAAAEYATRGITKDSAFFGIRRATYSSDMAKNALTFKHIANGQALPTTAPFLPNTSVNSEVHNSGEIWATMLWECYTSLLRAHPFAEAQSRMKSYVVNGYKLTPSAPTFLEARDAVLAAAYANDPADGDRFWHAFAKRGAGVGAVAPDRASTTHTGLVESFDEGSALSITSLQLLDDVPATSCDKDGVLDNGETGRLAITVRNAGSASATGATATVTTASYGVTLGTGGDTATVSFPAIPVGGSATAYVNVKLAGATTAQRLDFSVAARDDHQAKPGDQVKRLSVKANYNESPATSTKETVETKALPWTLQHDPALANVDFGVVFFNADLNRAFFGANPGAAGDVRLITPALQVSATEPLVLNFRQAYDFEQDTSVSPPDYYDGAVIELSDNDGQTWTDVGGALYRGTLYNDPVGYPTNQNPLKGRSAIVGTSAGFPALVPATLNLGTAYAGKTVKLRFRIGSDNGAAATGWILDDLAFSGINNTPFGSIVAQPAVCGANEAPVVSVSANQTVNERTPVLLTGGATDVNGDAITFLWTQVSGPTATLSGTTTTRLSFTAPEVTADSDLVFKLTASDGKTSSSANVTVRVLNVNRVPTVNAGLDGMVEARATYTLMGSATDADGDTLTYRWFQTAGTPVALTNANKAQASFVAPDVTLTQTLSFTLQVGDGKAFTEDSVDVVVNPVNRAPMVSIPNASQRVDEGGKASLFAQASDADGDTLSYTWTQVSGPAVSLSGANTPSPSFTAPSVTADTELKFELSVSDGTASTQASASVWVINRNQAPTANAGVDGTVAERAAYTLMGSASDADGDMVTYRWFQTAGTPVALTHANTLQASFIAPEVMTSETLTFTLQVSDGQATAEDSVNVVVNGENRAPTVLASANVTADERAPVTLQAQGQDADGDALTYHWTQLSGPAATLMGQDTASVTFTAPEVTATTELVFQVTVSDGTASASQDVKVTVKNVNRAPTANAGGAAMVDSGAQVQLNGGASSDPDGDALTYEWTQVGGPWATLEGANSATPTVTAPALTEDTELRFSLVVKDGSLSSQPSIVSVTVKGKPQTGGGNEDKGGCSATGAGAPLSFLGLGLLGLLRRRRVN